MPDRRSSSRKRPKEQLSGATPEELVRALSLPDAYPHPPDVVGFEQTQMSLVFIAGDFVYKIKKPVNLGYLDYSTLEKRHSLCRKEVELNRRLCPETYLGVVPIIRAGDSFAVEGSGEPVEYAVKMRRLPAERMLDRMLVRGEATAETMAAIARRVASFHHSSTTSPEIASFGSRSVVRGNTDENFEQTLPYIGRTITSWTHSAVRDYTNALLDSRAALFDARVSGGFIRDCHGDLHAAHVCMTGDVCIYDCIEFNDRFRYGDVASEVAFLAMDLDRYSRPDLSTAFVDAYVADSGDAGLQELLPFYKCYRAFVRGKVEGFRSSDSMVPAAEQETATWRARRYFELALEYSTGKGTLIVMSGVAGSGKSAVAAELAARLGCRVVASDVVRKRLAGIPSVERHYDPFGQGLYSPEWTKRTYEESVREAIVEAVRGHAVVLDASFLFRWQRSLVKEAAVRSGVKVLLIECVAPYRDMVDRLTQRQARPGISDGRPQILDDQLKTKESVSPVEGLEYIVLDTDRPMGQIVEELWQHL